MVGAQDIAASEMKPPERFTPAQARMHWIVAILVAAQLILGLRIGTIARTPENEALLSQLLSVHLITGTIIFGLMVARLRLRRRLGAPSSPVGTPFDAAMLAKINHYGFYALLLLMPVIGWFAYTADTRASRLFGSIHSALALVLVLAIAGHIAGVIYHSFIRRDGLVSRMALAKSRNAGA